MREDNVRKTREFYKLITTCHDDNFVTNVYDKMNDVVGHYENKGTTLEEHVAYIKHEIRTSEDY